MRAKVITREVRAGIVARLRAGGTYREVSEAVGVSLWTVKNTASVYGCMARGHRPPAAPVPAGLSRSERLAALNAHIMREREAQAQVVA